MIVSCFVWLMFLSFIKMAVNQAVIGILMATAIPPKRIEINS